MSGEPTFRGAPPPPYNAHGDFTSVVQAVG